MIFEWMNLTQNDVIIPLMLFVGGMQIDKNGHICQKPWMYTLGILSVLFAINHVLTGVLD